MASYNLEHLYHERSEMIEPCILALPPPKMTLGPMEEMDPKLWDNLQHHIDLVSIFTKLPFREFFQLRLVCKDFNARAFGEKFSEVYANPLSKKPFFCLVHPYGIWQVFVEYDQVSHKWHQLQAPTPNRTNDGFPPKWSAGGYLIFTENNGLDYWEFTVFDLHSRKQHKLPPLLRDFKSYDRDWNLEGLVLNQHDNTFQLVIAEMGATQIRTIRTSVYNSVTRAWDQKVQPFPLELNGLGVFQSSPHGSVCYNGTLYVSMDSVPYIMSYDLATRVWSSFQCPFQDSSVVALGCWDKRLYAISSMQSDIYTTAFHVHQLSEGTNKRWNEVCSIPLVLFDELFGRDLVSDEYVEASFCNEYVFICVFVRDYFVVPASAGYGFFPSTFMPENFALLNLRTEKWESLYFPELIVKERIWRDERIEG